MVPPKGGNVGTVGHNSHRQRQSENLLTEKIMDTDTANRIFADTQDMGVVLALQRAQTAISCTPVKNRHMRHPTDPKYQPFSEYVAEKNIIQPILIEIVSTDLYCYECSKSLGGLGGSDTEGLWLKLMERIETYRKVNGNV